MPLFASAPQTLDCRNCLCRYAHKDCSSFKSPCINIIYSSVIIPNKQGSSVVVGLAVQMFIVADTPTMAQAATHIITAVVTHITAASMVACHPKLVS